MDFLVNIDVPELAAGTHFYCASFGLTPGRRFGADAIELLGGPAPIYLLVKAEGSSPSTLSGQTRTYARHWSPVHLDFVVSDIDAAVSRALDAGARLEAPSTTAAWGKLALMADPFGNGFCLVQFLGRGYEEIVQP